MVYQLHKQGFQRLRIVPGMSGSGLHWRCSITPISNILVSHGALPRSYEENYASYSSSMDNYYFEWRDAQKDSARELAKKFKERSPEITELGRGRDWEYAGWYVEMLGVAEQGFLPVAYGDYYGESDQYLEADHCEQ